MKKILLLSVLLTIVATINTQAIQAADATTPGVTITTDKAACTETLTYDFSAPTGYKFNYIRQNWGWYFLDANKAVNTANYPSEFAINTDGAYWGGIQYIESKNSVIEDKAGYIIIPVQAGSIAIKLRATTETTNSNYKYQNFHVYSASSDGENNFTIGNEIEKVSFQSNKITTDAYVEITVNNIPNGWIAIQSDPCRISGLSNTYTPEVEYTINLSGKVRNQWGTPIVGASIELIYPSQNVENEFEPTDQTGEFDVTFTHTAPANAPFAVSALSDDEEADEPSNEPSGYKLRFTHNTLKYDETGKPTAQIIDIPKFALSGVNDLGDITLQADIMTGVDSVNAKNVSVLTIGNSIVVAGEYEKACVYDLQGKQVKANGLATGVYFVQVDGKTFKVAIH